MAGSWKHLVTKKGKFRGVSLIDNLGDAYEALEECYGMIHWLAHREIPVSLHDTPESLIELARLEYRRGIELSPGIKKQKASEDDGWRPRLTNRPPIDDSFFDGDDTEGEDA